MKIDNPGAYLMNDKIFIILAFIVISASSMAMPHRAEFRSVERVSMEREFRQKAQSYALQPQVLRETLIDQLATDLFPPGQSRENAKELIQDWVGLSASERIRPERQTFSQDMIEALLIAHAVEFIPQSIGVNHFPQLIRSRRNLAREVIEYGMKNNQALPISAANLIVLLRSGTPEEIQNVANVIQRAHLDPEFFNRNQLSSFSIGLEVYELLESIEQREQSETYLQHDDFHMDSLYIARLQGLQIELDTLRSQASGRRRLKELERNIQLLQNIEMETQIKRDEGLDIYIEHLRSEINLRSNEREQSQDWGKIEDLLAEINSLKEELSKVQSVREDYLEADLFAAP